MGSRWRMRSTRLTRHVSLPPSTLKSATLMAPVPTSTPAVIGMQFSCSGSDRATREFGGAERARVDGIRIDVDRHLTVVFLDQLAQLPNRGLVLGDAAGEGELVRHAARSRDNGDCAQDDRAMKAGENVLALFAERQTIAQFRAGEH